MTYRISIVNSRRVSGVKVRAYFLQVEIELRPPYTRESVTLEKNSIHNRKAEKSWDRLLGIAKEMPDKLDNLVGFLIGYDCAGDLKPKEGVAREDNDPF